MRYFKCINAFQDGYTKDEVYSIKNVRSFFTDGISFQEVLITAKSEKTFPREMMIHTIGKDIVKKTVQCIAGNRAIVEQCNKEGIIAYREWSELPEIQEMTVNEICKELGREIKIVK